MRQQPAAVRMNWGALSRRDIALKWSEVYNRANDAKWKTKYIFTDSYCVGNLY